MVEEGKTAPGLAEAASSAPPEQSKKREYVLGDGFALYAQVRALLNGIEDKFTEYALIRPRTDEDDWWPRRD